MFSDGKDEGDLRLRWEKQICMEGEEQGFSKDDCAVMLAFVRGIGRMDVEGERQHFREYHIVLEQHLCEARETLKSKGRVCLVAGISVGLVAALLLW